MVEVAEDIVHYAVAILLVAVSAIVLVSSVIDFFDTRSTDNSHPTVTTESTVAGATSDTTAPDTTAPDTTATDTTATDTTNDSTTFPERVTSVINSVLFVIIVMEILRTVVAHFDDAGLQLKPFLIIGIISAVRHILTVGAQVSLGGGGNAADFRRTQTELGVNAAVVLALVLGLVLVWRSERVAPDSPETDTTHGLVA
ncbi:MAG TPA: phosphate-starvation-inducible PsiE family protein [Acidimicrobiales bacterium]|nr:phosphate-starvation-inducible PsiE family protein [Acidimicrobiales bacterium]